MVLQNRQARNDSPSTLDDVPAKDEAPDISPKEDTDDDVPVKVHGEEHDEVGHGELRRMDQRPQSLLSDRQAELGRVVGQDIRGGLDKGGDERRDERGGDRDGCWAGVTAVGGRAGRSGHDLLFVLPRSFSLELGLVFLIRQCLFLVHPPSPPCGGDDDRTVVFPLQEFESL